jgi:hypothetical protein
MLARRAPAPPRAGGDRDPRITFADRAPRPRDPQKRMQAHECRSMRRNTSGGFYVVELPVGLIIPDKGIRKKLAAGVGQPSAGGRCPTVKVGTSQTMPATNDMPPFWDRVIAISPTPFRREP